jgi:hypothetical protein
MAAFRSCGFNVMVNLGALKNPSLTKEKMALHSEMERRAALLEARITKRVVAALAPPE